MRQIPILKEDPKRTRRNGHICTAAALLISATAAVCSTLGVRSIFGGGMIIISIAAFIEVVRITSIIMLNKYFEYIRGILRWVGLAFVSVACIFSMWSVSGYFLEQYHNISADATLISYDTSTTDYQIKDLQDSNKFTQEQIADLRKTLEQKREAYSALKNNEDGSMTSQQTKINNEINRINNEISSLNKQLTANNKQIATYRTSLSDLNKEYAEKSPEIQRLKPFAKMFGVTDESTIVMAIIVLLTIIFDPFAIFLIFWGNRIVRLADENEARLKEESETTQLIVEPIVQPVVKTVAKPTKKVVRKKPVSKVPAIIKEVKEKIQKVKKKEPKIEVAPVVEEKPIEKVPEKVETPKEVESNVKTQVKKIRQIVKKQRLNPTEEEPIVRKVRS